MFGKWYILGRVEGQVWFGTTTEIIPNGGEGGVDVVTPDGTINIKSRCWFPEEIGSGVKVVGAYAPDGNRYIFAAECEEEGGAGGPVNPTPV